MNRDRIVGALAAAAIVLSTHTLGADVRADQKTKVEFGGTLGRITNFFAGKAAKEGVLSMAAVKGDRKATMTGGQTGQIIDLAEEKIYDLDLKKKSYTVTTFAEIRRRMEEARKRAEDDARKQGPADTPPPPSENDKQMEVDVDVKNTGATRTINGFDARQVIMTITLREKGKTVEQGGGMIATTDMWMAPRIAAMKEIADFDLRYAQKLYGGFAGASAEQMAAAMALYPMMKQALGRMSVEGTKIEGTPILTTVTMDAVKSEAQMAEQAKGESQSAPAPTVGGLLGGLARKVGPKKADTSSPRATFMTSTNEVLKVGTDVTAGDVAIPAGFKENK